MEKYRMESLSLSLSLSLILSLSLSISLSSPSRKQQKVDRVTNVNVGDLLFLSLILQFGFLFSLILSYFWYMDQRTEREGGRERKKGRKRESLKGSWRKKVSRSQKVRKIDSGREEKKRWKWEKREREWMKQFTSWILLFVISFHAWITITLYLPFSTSLFSSLSLKSIFSHFLSLLLLKTSQRSWTSCRFMFTSLSRTLHLSHSFLFSWLLSNFLAGNEDFSSQLFSFLLSLQSH